MSDRAWYYTAAGNRQGPIDESTLRAMAGDGRLPADAFVWTDGMAQWLPVAQVAELQGVGHVAAVAAAPHAAPQVAYYNPSGGMPARAAATLQGHARPLGDTGDWPLDDARIAQFEQAIKLRKKVASAAQLYRTLLFLTAIGATVMVVVGIGTVATSGGGGGRVMAMGLPMAAAGAMLVGVTLLYWFAWRATNRSHRWAPLTMFILYLAFGAFQLLSIALAMGSSSVAAGGQAVGAFISLLFMAGFAAVSWRAFAAIPKYLACPAWCQEVLVKAGV